MRTISLLSAMADFLTRKDFSLEVGLSTFLGESIEYFLGAVRVLLCTLAVRVLLELCTLGVLPLGGSLVLWDRNT